MSRVAHYLQEHLLGEVTASTEVRRHFAHDASVLQLVPEIVVYPRTESDVRKVARFTWQLAERGRVMPITSRGGGSNTSGSAIGSGILLIFTAHMNKILVLDPKKQIIIVEPGTTYDKIEQTLYTHGLFLPPYPASAHYATIGGGIATNAIGEKSLKYGSTGDFVESLRVVLANGEVMETGPLSKRELSNKLGLTTFEGQIYRELDKLMEENSDLIASMQNKIQAANNAIGYNLHHVKKKGSFDLTPLLIGSQGTLGIITEAVLGVALHNPTTDMALLSLTNIEQLNEILRRILNLRPSICDFINRPAIDLVNRINPNQLGNVLENPTAAIHLLVEFDDPSDGARDKALKSLGKLSRDFEATFKVAKNQDERQEFWKIRHSVSTILTQAQGQTKAVPAAEDVSIQPDKLSDFLTHAGAIYEQNGLVPAAWGQAGSGVVRMQPMLDLSEVGDRQKFFKVTDSIYALAKQLGGSLSAAAGDGRLRAPYTASFLGNEYFELFAKVKKIFDPLGILNPGVKFANIDEVKNMMRADYSLAHHHESLPRS